MKASKLPAALFKQNETRGGARDTETKELAVNPHNKLLKEVVITHTPVGNLPTAFLKSSVCIN